jgi:hypothetical protein
MALPNRVDPYGDLHESDTRGLFTGNRGCLVNEYGQFVRHHQGSLWITCVLRYKNWKAPLNAPRHWTPLFFLDDAVALAAGHRPCGLCRREDYISYKESIARSMNLGVAPSAADLNRMVARERHRPGRGRARSADRRLWSADIVDLLSGTVFEGVDSIPTLFASGRFYEFSFAGWIPALTPLNASVQVLTPPTSFAALAGGFRPKLHASAA